MFKQDTPHTEVSNTNRRLSKYNTEVVYKSKLSTIRCLTGKLMLYSESCCLTWYLDHCLIMCVYETLLSRKIFFKLFHVNTLYTRPWSRQSDEQCYMAIFFYLYCIESYYPRRERSFVE